MAIHFDISCEIHVTVQTVEIAFCKPFQSDRDCEDLLRNSHRYELRHCFVHVVFIQLGTLSVIKFICNAIIQWNSVIKI